MKSLADIAGLNKQPNVKIGYNYTFDLAPDAMQIQSDMLAGKNTSGLIKAIPYIIPEPVVQDPAKQLAPTASIAKMEDDTIPTGLTGKDFEKWIRRTGDDKILEYYTDFYNKRKEAGTKITEKDFAVVKQQIKDYMSTPLYSERQANFPEEYPVKDPDPKYVPFYDEFGKKVPEWKREKRMKLLDELQINLDNSGKDTAHFASNQVGPSGIYISPEWGQGTIAHEIGHSIQDYKAPITDEQKAKMKESGGVLKYEEQLGYASHASDNYNASNFLKRREAPLDIVKDRADPSLNKGEIEMFYKLAKPLNLTTDNPRYRDVDKFKLARDLTPLEQSNIKYNEALDKKARANRDAYSKFSHFNKDVGNKADFVEEQYGDLYAIRQLLLSEGVTNSFGEELDVDKMNKAIINKNITDNPSFRRFYYRYGKDNIIKLNNTIAMNNNLGNMNNDTLNA
jgi:hypothetical protein